MRPWQSLLRGLRPANSQALHPASPSTSTYGAPAIRLSQDVARLPAWKRALDLWCALIAIPVLLPILIFIAVIIKLGSMGPLLFKQERVGHRGNRFVLYKFRTMRPGVDTAVHEEHVARLIEDDAPMIKLDTHGDARLIPFGRALRASGLDELPQILNVLRGEMSFVGPRPCLPSEYEMYLDWQKQRFLTPPGLTGLWQVSGKNRTTFREMIDLDLQYVARRSLWLDVKIMLRTIPCVMAELSDVRSAAATARSSDATVLGAGERPAAGDISLGGGA